MKRVSKALTYTVLLLWLAAVVLPMIWVFSNSIRSSQEIYENSFGLPWLVTGSPYADRPEKTGLLQLTRYLATTLAPDIRVNAISPGTFDTAMMDYVRDDPSKLDSFLAQVPMKRAGGEDDIKGAAVFLASDAAQYITGQNLVVDGGWLVRG